ncbi:hypothetical protein KA005_26050, partial [bacterium]|nr:hypothetical protein [bacterium]
TVAPLAATELAKQTGVFPKEIEPLINPELVTPVVAYLCSEHCQASGDIISAGGGYYSMVQVVEGRGIRLSLEQEITPEMIAEKYSEISKMERAVGFKSIKDELGVVLGPLMKVMKTKD